MIKDLETIYQSMIIESSDNADVNAAKATIDNQLKGITNYYKGLVYQIENDPNNMGLVKDLNDLSAYLVKKLAWASQFSAPEDSTYYQG